MEQALDLFDQLGEREDVARGHAEFGLQLSKDDHETRSTTTPACGRALIPPTPHA
jgi:hypothetical protein